MTDMSSFNMERDHELGTALQSALASHHDGAFLTRMRARLAQQRTRSWDEELAHWFWRGLAAATAAMAVAGFGLSQVPSASASIDETAEASVATRLLEGAQPGADILFMAQAGQ